MGTLLGVLDELESMRASCYVTRVSALQLKSRFENAGGVPRLVLSGPGLDPGHDSATTVISDRQEFPAERFVKGSRPS